MVVLVLVLHLFQNNLIFRVVALVESAVEDKLDVLEM